MNHNNHAEEVQLNQCDNAPEIDEDRDSMHLRALLRSTCQQALAILSMISLASSLGCKKEVSKSSKPKTEVERTPHTTDELKQVQKELMILLRQYMKESLNVEIPTDIKLKLSGTKEDYIEAGSKNQRAYGLHTIGFYSVKDRVVFLNEKTSADLVDLMRNRNGDSRSKITCSTVASVGTLIHEIAHALTKDFKKNRWGNYAYFTSTMHEALAAETEEFAPSFIEFATPKSNIPGNCTVGATVVKVENQRYEVINRKGSYPDHVTFETYLFSLSGECEEEINNRNGTWASCALDALMNKSFKQTGAGLILNKIKKKNPKCRSSRKYMRQIDAALIYAEAPYLQYAISQCDGGEIIPNVACTSILTEKNIGDSHIMDSLTLGGRFPSGRWTGWSQTLEDLENGSTYELNRPLRFQDGIFPMWNTLPRYASTFTRPHSPSDPCILRFSQNYYCNQFQLSGFTSDVPVFISLMLNGSQYMKGKYANGDTISNPILEGTDIYVKAGNKHMTAEVVDIENEKCTVSPVGDSSK